MYTLKNYGFIPYCFNVTCWCFVQVIRLNPHTFKKIWYLWLPKWQTNIFVCPINDIFISHDLSATAHHNSINSLKPRFNPHPRCRTVSHSDANLVHQELFLLFHPKWVTAYALLWVCFLITSAGCTWSLWSSTQPCNFHVNCLLLYTLTMHLYTCPKQHCSFSGCCWSLALTSFWEPASMLRCHLPPIQTKCEITCKYYSN